MAEHNISYPETAHVTVHKLHKAETIEPSQEIYTYQPPAQQSRSARRPCWKPRKGRKRMIVIALVVTLVTFFLSLIAGPTLGYIYSQYPDYGHIDYVLVDEFSRHPFFDNFWYFTDEDPTLGFVEYVNQTTAETMSLTQATESSVIIRVDNKTSHAPRGRKSVRLESRKTYHSGLFLFDIIHTPYGCGTWPALWLADTYNWPLNGEIDVLETTNGGTEGNTVTLHTTQGCSVKGRRKQTGKALHSTCDDQHGTVGCDVQAPPATYGPEFNENGGGVYAVELQHAGIRVWMFPRSSIPEDLVKPHYSPDPSSWGTPLADFPSTNCFTPQYFRNQSIIINIDLCGEMGAQPEVYSDLYNCPATCEEYVSGNAREFSEAYWEFGWFRVYQSR
ncbi:glycoside hydrolase family 16 protein [Aspergillus clavatus NRRL 1]|uniref:endo-1,3(4)-beta-glucanase n=1 Tax=Aspergillus clavatus (strain ATCC 1007 / CBS 513.65 / DSM 816 / NCTC 3887 / NRRL 1 / QM 1276 / 107) TaxID=344612 RepID=A1CIQ8_ASPCL|nr:endo-1,3(4)-beta-glucanase, putative [Aspergillus clavatus NRRL 1]EAW10763.1 endo-1,3(4)-beta-glucanase, putative [Aspergillus clavatus NRRL 1]